MAFSVLILTRNEEQNLPGCLESVGWCDDIVVLDSHSEDGTVNVARKAGARVFQRPFDDFAGQRNFALGNISFRYPWVFHLDADERFTPELHREVLAKTNDTSLLAFRVPSKTIFFGRWLKHAGMYPTYQVRLTRLPGFRFRQVGHGQKEAIGADLIGTLHEPYDHYAFSKGLEEWVEKHNRYSTQEAAETLQQLASGRMQWSVLLSRDPDQRRQGLRNLAYRLPCRPLFRFMYMYVLRRGFLDGASGFRYCCLLAWYEFLIALKVLESRKKIAGEEH